MNTSTIAWHRTSDTYAGFMDGDSWRYADAIPSPMPQFWAHFPQGPEVAKRSRREK